MAAKLLFLYLLAVAGLQAVQAAPILDERQDVSNITGFRFGPIGPLPAPKPIGPVLGPVLAPIPVFNSSLKRDAHSNLDQRQDASDITLGGPPLPPRPIGPLLPPPLPPKPIGPLLPPKPIGPGAGA